MGQGPDHVTLTPAFKSILLAILALTVTFLGVSLFLVIRYEGYEGGPPEHAMGLLQGCTHLFAAGAGAIFGLVGGKLT
jgi:hypothetical protein